MVMEGKLVVTKVTPGDFLLVSLLEPPRLLRALSVDEEIPGGLVFNSEKVL